MTTRGGAARHDEESRSYHTSEDADREPRSFAPVGADPCGQRAGATPAGRRAAVFCPHFSTADTGDNVLTELQQDMKGAKGTTLLTPTHQASRRLYWTSGRPVRHSANRGEFLCG